MSARKNSLYKQPFSIAVFAIVISLLFVGSAHGQDFKRPDGSVPLPLDWSDSHVIYTTGFTPEQASYLQDDPRYFVAMRLHGKALADENTADENPTTSSWESSEDAAWGSRPEPPGGPRREATELKVDWSVSLGPTAGVAAGQSPAKFSFDVNAAPSCTADYAVFPINAATGYTRAHVVGTFSTTVAGTNGHNVVFTVTPTGGTAITLTLTSSLSVNTGTSFLVYSSASTANATLEATNLAAAINRNLSATALGRIVAVASTNTVTVYTLTPGSREVLTVSTGGLTALTFGTVTAGANGTQANIAGFNHLYSGTTPFCTGYTDPTFIFSYASGAGPVTTSPVLSLAGTKVAYIENGPSVGMVLHVLTFGSGATEYGTCTNSGTALPTCATHPVVPGSTAGSTATDFMVPLSLPTLGTVASDTLSSPFVNYSTDTLYVGDNTGHLYAVTGVFKGTPALAAAPFPVTVSTATSPANMLTSPVLDVSGTGDIFIGDGASNVYDYSSAGAIVGTSQSIGNSTNGGIHDGPIVDSSNSKVYFTTNCSGTGGRQQIAQFPFSASGLGTAVKVLLNAQGCASGAAAQRSVTPDSQYYTKGISSATAANNGHLLVCFQNSTAPTVPHLAQYQFVSGALQTTAQYNNGSFITTGALQSCSPTTEFYGSDVAYTPTVLTQSGTTVTVTTATNKFVSNQVVTIAGVTAGSGGCTAAAVAAINGEKKVTVLSATQFTFTSSVSTTITSGSCTLTGSSATGPTQDYVFFGTSQPSAWTFTLPMTSSTQAATASNTTSVTGGTSGIIVDNDSTLGQASSIYFGTQATSTTQCGTTAAYCAVKLTQSALR